MEKLEIGTLEATHAKNKQTKKVIINSRKNKYIVHNWTVTIERGSAVYNI